MMQLKHEADLPVADRGQLPGRQREQIAPGQFHPAGVGPVQRAQHVQQRTLADARLADDRYPLGRQDCEIKTLQHAHRVVSFAVPFAESAGLEQEIGHPLRSWNRC